MIDREKVIKELEWQINVFTSYCASDERLLEAMKAALAMLKEQPEIIYCKDCIHRGKSEKCVLAAISEEKDYPLFMLDNRGDWFCADGERRLADG